ncbi:peptidase domain-containing ABC transporter [Acidithiobacillus sp.]|uniref:peptidase domain-containing ABC transporter n=1 Tax=Acidithiobacillus sp. TaxID=1872118 RepID=UPI00260836A1|nr:peptidase domain-containing ABC transporter [Acidithiobacillus sp.]MDD5278812.1 peptidase domain-containing ABC transporter [Acidithiobacillus sp.]
MTGQDSEQDNGTPGSPAESPRPAQPVSSGLQCLAMIAGYYQRPCNAEQLARALGMTAPILPPGKIILAAREVKLVAKVVQLQWADLARQHYPVMAELKDGNYIVLGRFENQRLVAVDPTRGQLILDQATLEKAWTGRVIFLKPRFSWGAENQRFGLRWFIPIILKYRKPVIEVLMAAFVVQMFGLAMPLFVQLVIDRVLVYHSLPTLDILAIGMLLVIAFETTLNVLKTLMMTHTTNRIDVTLGARLFAHVLRIPMRYFETRTVGSTVARVRELEVVRQFLTGPTLMSFIDIWFIGIFIIVLLFYSGLLTLVVLATIPFMVGLSLAIFPVLRRLLQEKFDRSAENQSFLVETITGIQTVKALAVESKIYQRWEESLSRYVMASYRVDRLAGVTSAFTQMIQRLGTLAILWVGVKLVLDGELSVGELIAFQMISGQVTGPILRLAQLWQHFQQVGVSVSRMGDLMNTPAEPVVDIGKASPPALHGRVTLDKLRFRYTADTEEVLKGISFDIPAGSFVGIVGRSGSGKSTLAKMLQRLYLPDSGAVLIDGIDLRHVEPNWLRRQIGVVLQENFLFSGTIRENITMVYPEATLDRVIAAAQLAGAHEFISKMPDAYDTKVGERGDSLSGGQRQRIAIARALLGDPRILIFDEATSALDYESERIIWKNLHKICEGRTVFMAAHRLASIRSADIILVMDDGEIVEQGAHQTLIAQNGVYALLAHDEEGAN